MTDARAAIGATNHQADEADQAEPTRTDKSNTALKQPTGPNNGQAAWAPHKAKHIMIHDTES